MRIVLVNWARIWHGASVGGGVNGYTQSLALALRDLGHEVVSLCAGTAYRQDAGGGACHIRRHPDWLKIPVYEVFNSPVRAPSHLQFDSPEGEITHPELERQVGDLFSWLRPDVVHFHNIEGLTAGCIHAAKRAGATVLYSLHNYHTICPQVYLMQGRVLPCRDFDNGHNCVNCPKKFDQPGAEDSKPKRLGGPQRADPKEPLPGVVVESADAVGREMVLAVPDRRGSTLRILGSNGGQDSAAPRPQTPLENTPTPEPESDRPPNAYARRRAAMIDALNACDRVLAVSRFVAEKFCAMGVERARVQTLTIGTRMAELAHKSPGAVAPPRPRAERNDGGLLKLLFLGFHNPYKGLPLLADAIESLEPETLERIHLCVHAAGAKAIESRFRRIESRLGRMTYSGAYQYEDVPWIIGGADIGVVPSVWWDNGPQTVMEMLACGVPVLGAELGGIPDFIEDGVNGLLFRGADAADLADKIRRLVGEPGLVEKLRAGVRAPKSMSAHVREIESVYASLLGSAAP